MSLREMRVIACVLALGIGNFLMSGQAGAGGTLVSAGPPLYPVAAKAAGIEGQVTLQGVIGRDGQIRGLRVIKGPVELQQAAIDAVGKWKYRPDVRDGNPIESRTTVTVNFTMGSKKEKAKAQAAAQAALAKEEPESAAQTQEPAKKKN